MRCFVACAFGKADVDSIYDVIERVLISLGITALRVDKLNHNKKIDQKIIELIGKCDFGIADLTYARQSVYYEAGRIHGRSKEVVFTCRKDHFKGTRDDQRVHFDLSTENIISWLSPTKEFEQNLKRRVKLVISPLLAEIKSENLLRIEKDDYSKLSHHEKINFIRVNAIKYFREHGYAVDPSDGLTAVAIKGKRIVLSVSANPRGFKGLGELLNIFVPISYQESAYGGVFKEKTTIICMIAKMSESAIHRVLPDYSKTNIAIKKYTKVDVDGTIRHVAFLDGIKSLSDINNRLGSFLA